MDETKVPMLIAAMSGPWGTLVGISTAANAPDLVAICTTPWEGSPPTDVHRWGIEALYAGREWLGIRVHDGNFHVPEFVGLRIEKIEGKLRVTPLPLVQVIPGIAQLGKPRDEAKALQDVGVFASLGLLVDRGWPGFHQTVIGSALLGLHQWNVSEELLHGSGEAPTASSRREVNATPSVGAQQALLAQMQQLLGLGRPDTDTDTDTDALDVEAAPASSPNWHGQRPTSELLPETILNLNDVGTQQALKMSGPAGARVRIEVNWGFAEVTDVTTEQVEYRLIGTFQEVSQSSPTAALIALAPTAPSGVMGATEADAALLAARKPVNHTVFLLLTREGVLSFQPCADADCHTPHLTSALDVVFHPDNRRQLSAALFLLRSWAHEVWPDFPSSEVDQALTQMGIGATPMPVTRLDKMIFTHSVGEA